VLEKLDSRRCRPRLCRTGEIVAASMGSCHTTVGDHQCALAGVLLEEGELSINVSTGSQVAAIASRFDRPSTRPAVLRRTLPANGDAHTGRPRAERAHRSIDGARRGDQARGHISNRRQRRWTGPTFERTSRSSQVRAASVARSRTYMKGICRPERLPRGARIDGAQLRSLRGANRGPDSWRRIVFSGGSPCVRNFCAG